MTDAANDLLTLINQGLAQPTKTKDLPVANTNPSAKDLENQILAGMEKARVEQAEKQAAAARAEAERVPPMTMLNSLVRSLDIGQDAWWKEETEKARKSALEKERKAKREGLFWEKW